MEICSLIYSKVTENHSDKNYVIEVEKKNEIVQTLDVYESVGVWCVECECMKKKQPYSRFIYKFGPTCTTEMAKYL